MKTSKHTILQWIIFPSTQEFFKLGRHVPGYRFRDFLHGYIYARWPYLYIAIGTGEHPLAKRFAPWVTRFNSWFGQNNGSKNNRGERTTLADTYHGKVIPLEEAHRLVSIKENISLINLEKIIPYATARDIILQNPDHIVVLDCPCRSARANPCQPLDVCLAIGEPFASFVIEHIPKRSRWITSQEAQEIIRQEHERNHVHHAFFKDVMLGRFYAICNCCSCCCGAINAHRNGTPMLASSGYVCHVDTDLCLGCGECHSTCQFDALSMGNIGVKVNESRCMGCGICVSNCEQNALSLVRAPEKGHPLEIQQLMNSILS